MHKLGFHVRLTCYENAYRSISTGSGWLEGLTARQRRLLLAFSLAESSSTACTQILTSLSFQGLNAIGSVINPADSTINSVMGVKTSSMHSAHLEPLDITNLSERANEDDSLQVAFSLPCVPSFAAQPDTVAKKKPSHIASPTISRPLFFYNACNGSHM